MQVEQAPAETKVHFRGLNSLRFLAALFVVVGHVPMNQASVGLPFYATATFFYRGAPAVSFFFTLSGFLITYLLLEEARRTGDVDVRKFYARRICRIWPLYFAVVFFGLVFYNALLPLAGIPYKVEYNLPTALVLYSLLLANLMNSLYSVGGILNPLWSIGVEEQFYLAWAPAVKRLRRHVPALCTLVFCVSFAVFVLSHEDAFGQQTWKKLAAQLKFHFMAAGGLCAWWLHRRREAFLALPPFSSKLLQSALFALLLDFYLTSFVRWGWWGQEVAQILLYSWVIVTVAANPRNVVRVENRAFEFLGTISYGIYMLHMIAVYATSYLFKSTGWWQGTPWLYHATYYAMALSLTLLLAYISFRLLEMPFLRLKDRFALVPSTPLAGQDPAPYRLVYLCDWLPPDFGAVGQYSLLFARERAARGEDVVLAGLSSTTGSNAEERPGAGRLRIVRVRAATYDRTNFRARALWTARTNLTLLWRLRRELRQADEVLFTGSPPFLIHFLAPGNLLMRRRLTYRITDFHPECLMAEMERVPAPLRLFHRWTVFLRRRIHRFEVLGDDQRNRLLEIGIRPERIVLKRDPSPVEIPGDAVPLNLPEELRGRTVLLYSGNFGVAHDHETFVAGYRRHHQEGSGRVGLWLNATGAKADRVEELLRRDGLPVHRSRPLPLDLLPRLLMTPAAHLVTLRDEFVGYVLPSKVYGCIQSRRHLLYVGSARSDIHLLASRDLPPERYLRLEVGDTVGVARALEEIARMVPTMTEPNHETIR